MCGMIDAVGKCFKTAVAFVCFLLIGGLALIIVGSIFLNKPNNHALYNEALKGFDSKPVESWIGSMNGVPVSIRHESLSPSGVFPAVSVFMQAFLRAPKPNIIPYTYDITVNVSNVQPFVRQVPAYKEESQEFICSTSAYSKCAIDFTKFHSTCVTTDGKYKTATCPPEFDRCGTCIHYRVLASAYLVVSEVSPGHYAEDPTIKSARYNFGEDANDYTEKWPPTIEVRLYSNKDPRIALERYTKGKGSFGINPRTAGIAMIVVGTVLLAFGIACTAVVCIFCRRKTPPGAGAAKGKASTAAGPSPAYAHGNSSSQSYGKQHEAQAQGYVYGKPLRTQGYGYGESAQPLGYVYGKPLRTQGYGYGESAQPQGYGYGKPPQGRGYGYGQPPPA